MLQMPWLAGSQAKALAGEGYQKKAMVNIMLMISY